MIRVPYSKDIASFKEGEGFIYGDLDIGLCYCVMKEPNYGTNKSLVDVMDQGNHYLTQRPLAISTLGSSLIIPTRKTAREEIKHGQWFLDLKNATIGRTRHGESLEKHSLFLENDYQGPPPEEVYIISQEWATCLIRYAEEQGSSHQKKERRTTP